MPSPAFEQCSAVGRRHFEAHAWFAAHEAFEAGWRVCRGDEKRVLQVLVLWAAALHQHERGRGDGARRLLARALERVGAVDDGFDGLDVDALKASVIETWGQLVTGEVVSPAWPAAPLAAPSPLSLEHHAHCPSCGERVLVEVTLEDASGAQYVEDCPVCCRPWQVRVRRDGEGVATSLRRLDA